MMNILIENSGKIKKIISLSLIYLSVGIFYSGKNFMVHITDGIPAGAAGGQVIQMKPGDHHEQFYRYSLVKTNLERGRTPYYSGYQYAGEKESKVFSEGMVFFPFTLINAFLAFLFGDILAYNILLLLSYVYTGLIMYILVYYYTKSWIASFLSSLFLALVPFRTSFLYGEMVYGVDLALIPLALLFFEKATTEYKKIYFFISGLIFFLCMTANFQMFYWFLFITSPYLAYKFFKFLNDNSFSFKDKTTMSILFSIGVFGVLLYAIYILQIMKASVLNSGQSINEVLVYTPDIKNLFQINNGNEKNVNLGLTVLIIIPFLFSKYFSKLENHEEKRKIIFFLIMFFWSYYLCFAPKIDQVTGVGFFQLMFDHIPGFNGTRTTGRIMAVTSVLYAIILGYAIKYIFEILSLTLDKKNIKHQKLLIQGAVIFISIIMIWNFKYTTPNINLFEKENQAYNKIGFQQNKIITLPFQLQSAHYYNATFLTYALKYDLRLFTGHSSVYPIAIDRIALFLSSLNNGILSEEQWKWLKNNDYKYIVAHNTELQPKVDKFALLLLKRNPNLNFISSDNGIYVFSINDQFTKVSNNYFIDDLSFLGINNSKDINIFPESGWYPREAPPGQIPFRWMHGTDSYMIIPHAKNYAKSNIIFEYKCPYDDLTIDILSGKFEEKIDTLSGGWKRMNIKAFNVKKMTLISLKTKREFYGKGKDPRIFGCMIGDITIDGQILK